VVGSYLLAERLRKPRRRATAPSDVRPAPGRGQRASFDDAGRPAELVRHD
jgi:hypothetical protein